MNTQSRDYSVKHRLINIAKLTVVLGLSLLLLIFIGQGEARRTYPQFEIEKLAAQGELAQIGMRNLLMADIPLDQFPGFATLTQPILDSDSSIHAIYVTDNTGTAIFSNLQPRAGGGAVLDLADPALLTRFQGSSLQPEAGRYRVTEDTSFYQVNFDLENRFTRVGELHIALPKSVVESTISSSFDNAKLAAVGLLAVYAIFLFMTSKQWLGSDESGWEKGGVRLLGISYAVSFLVMAALVVITLIGIYSDGIIAKTESLADSLEYRLASAFDLGLALDDFTGVDAAFADYQQLNPDLSYVVLTREGLLALETGAGQIGTYWAPRQDHFDSARILASHAPPAGGALILHLGIPKSIVYSRLWRSAKNFVALFVASAFLTQLFFSLIRSQTNQPKLTPGTLHTKRGFLLSLIGPLYFIMVFVTSGLNASFLPQYFQELAQKAGTQIDSSTLFSIYYAAYAVALLVTGRLAERRGPKPLLIVGGALILAALLMLIFVPTYYVLFVVQATTGFGEGMFFIAVQSYVLKVASRHQRTKAAAIIVNSLYGGLLSGTAVGSLLAADPTVGHRGVFALGGLITVFILSYTIWLIPRIVNEEFDRGRESAAAMAQALGMEDATMTLYAPGQQGRGSAFSVFKDLDFVRTAILIGVPVKIIMAGLFKASLPLVLTRQNYSTDDVGQVMMLYSIGVLATSAVIPRIADRMGKTRLILFLGAVGSGLGLVLIGLMGWDRIVGTGLSYLATTLLLTGMVVLGISHGFIQAPIMTHISSTRTARRMGKSTATSIYRLIERVGNIGGPVIVGALLVRTSYDAMTVSWIGMAVVVFGLLFVIQFQRRKVAR